jgi:hypothetical protein
MTEAVYARELVTCQIQLSFEVRQRIGSTRRPKFANKFPLDPLYGLPGLLNPIPDRLYRGGRGDNGNMELSL